MSSLYYSESGRVAEFVNEELSRRRHARKLFHLPAKVSDGTLYIYARSHPGCQAPLHVKVNGHDFEIEPDGLTFLHWLSLRLEGAHLRPGTNAVEFWSDNIAMDGWVIGLEGNVHASDSALSLNGGADWQNERMGIHHCLRGEYVVRLRLNDESLSDPEPPEPAWERPDCPLFEEMRRLIPSDIQKLAEPWERARALATWVSTQWVYRNADTGIEYAPWDPLTILSWGKSAHGQARRDPIVMCVHYAILFSSAALSLGIPARNICCTDGLGGEAGHFVSEVWMEKWRKWCQVDANCDIVYVKDGVPLSVEELYPSRHELPRLAVRGPGFERQIPFIRQAAEEYFITGGSFALWAIWPRNDYLSHPEDTPPLHGAGSYVETDWLWARTVPDVELGMFPHILMPQQLRGEPPPEWLSRG